ncbi:Protein Y73B6BL.29 [Aphelenchoides avenae]|nr:Protein Y73B6BL.29 [Aphelenchus avenae]
MAEAALNGARRYLFWVGYDGSKFLEMAKGNTGYGVVDLLRRCLEYALPVASPDDIKLAPSSRTDSKVHAIRTPVIVHTPVECGTLDECPARKSKFMNYFNGLLSAAVPDGIHLLDFHSVSPGFQPRHHVSYR